MLILLNRTEISSQSQNVTNLSFPLGLTSTVIQQHILILLGSNIFVCSESLIFPDIIVFVSNFLKF